MEDNAKQDIPTDLAKQLGSIIYITKFLDGRVDHMEFWKTAYGRISGGGKPLRERPRLKQPVQKPNVIRYILSVTTSKFPDTDYPSSRSKYNQAILDYEIDGSTFYYDMKMVSWDGKTVGYDAAYMSLMDYMQLTLDRNPMIYISFSVSDSYYEKLNEGRIASTVDCKWCDGTGMSNLSCYHCDGSGCAWCKYG
ncbi:MAG: hypothetical protein V8R61_08175 [Enterocloster sp.]